MQNLTSQAISAALAQKWDEAVDINIKILQQNKNDIDAYNRLAYAYTHLGEIEKSSLQMEFTKEVARKSGIDMDDEELYAVGNMIKEIQLERKLEEKDRAIEEKDRAIEEKDKIIKDLKEQLKHNK